MNKHIYLALLFIFLVCPFFVQAQVGFPYCESFSGGDIQSTTVFGGSAKLVNGALRLTEAISDQNGYVYIDVPFSSAYGIKASFEYFMYGGSGADGLSVFLFDAETQNFRPGGFGGSLGYAQKDNNPGLTGAYLGLGFDSFGNFGNSGENKRGGFLGGSTSLFPNSIVLRKGGSGFAGYDFVNGKVTFDPPPGNGTIALDVQYQFPLSSGGFGTGRVEDINQPGYRKVLLELEPHPSGVGYLVKLEMIVTTVQNEPRTITIIPGAAFTYEAPRNLKIGFAASTGGETNIHEIKNLLLEVSNEGGLVNPQGVDFSGITSCEGQENQYLITDEEITLPNENSEIRCLQFYASLDDIDAETDDICTQGKCREENRILEIPQGTFKAGTNGGDYTFFPNEGFSDQSVTVYYTITDTYGKSSGGNAITLKIQESPEPVEIYVEGSPEINDEVNLCGGESVVLISKGGESYIRYEWYRDEVLIQGASAESYLADVEGEYLVKAYNRQNCPAISNSIRLSFPKFPEFELNSPVIGCSPAQGVDVTLSITGYDPFLYNYKLSGEGLIFLDDEMKEVLTPGLYLLQIKHAGQDCYSSPAPLKIVILEEEFMADFDFEIQGTGVKGEVDGGFFPDDIFQFTDSSSEDAQSWSWDFGDGITSTEKNPTHVYGEKGDFDVVLIISNEWGCISTMEKKVSILRSYRVMFPTGFTPLDESNKYFIPKYKGLISGQLLIFNIWGDLIFETDDLSSPGWDGTLEGRLLDAGIYVYRYNAVAIDGEKVTRSGKFKLIR